MRPRVLRRRLILAGLGGMIAAATITTGIAKADTDICASLAASPTVGTVEQLVGSYMAGGLSGKDAGTLIAATVLGTCPQFAPVLQRFVNAYTGTVRA